MAVDKLIDSAKETACRTAEANAIRAKTGGTAAIPFDFDGEKGFADAISSIPTGGGGDWYPTPITAGDTPVMMSSVHSAAATSTQSLTSIGMEITIPKNGTYRFKWNMHSEEGTSYTQLFRNGTAVGSQISAREAEKACSLDLACAAGDEVEVRIRGARYSGYTYGGCGGFVACINGNNGFQG